MRILVLLTVLMFCLACDGLTSALIPPSDEVDLGYELETELRSEIRLHPDPEVQAYLNTLGQRILAEVPNVRDAYEFRFHVVDNDDVVNAFAVPGGGIFIYTGLILTAQTEAEVAGVLGHEIAHVIERHGAKRLVTQYGIEQVLSLLLGNDIGAFAQMLTELAATGALLKYSRDNELESDKAGIRWVVAAGYSPEGLIRFFETLDAIAGASLPEFLSTHPNPENRVDQLLGTIGRLGVLPTYEGDQAAFEAWQNRIIGVIN